MNLKNSYYDASGNFGSVQENYIHSNKRLIKCLDEIDWVYICGDGNLRHVLSTEFNASHVASEHPGL